MAQRFSKQLRLRKGSEFRQVFHKSIKSSDRYLTVLARVNTLNLPRVGLAIAKKKVKRAVDRNRVKRVIREAFRLHQQDLGSLDYVVLAKAHLSSLTNVQITNALLKHWQAIQLKCEKLSSQ